MQQNSSRREIHRDKCLPQKTRKFSKYSTLYVKKLKKMLKVSRGQKITKSRADINKIETKMAIEKIYKTKNYFF